MHIRPLGFLDTSSFTATLLTRHGRQLTEDGEIVLRGPDPETGDIAERAILKDWKSARGLIARIRNNAAPYFDNKLFELGRIFVDRLGVRASTPWTVEDDETLIRLRIGLVPSPGAMTYSGGEGVIVHAGSVFVVEHRVPHCELNMGPCSRSHLVVEIHRGV